MRTNFFWIFLVIGLLLAMAIFRTQADSNHPVPENATSRVGTPLSATEAAVIVKNEPTAQAVWEKATAEPVTAATDPVVVTTEPVIVTAEPRSPTKKDPPNQLETGQRRANPQECNWKITFWDEFEGVHLDVERWDTGYKAGDKEAQYYVEDVFAVENGILSIRAEERQVKDRNYASGIITTQGRFEQRYGRFEARVRVPAGQGLWPAFWLMPNAPVWPMEIDVFEILGHEPDTAYMTNHWTDEDGKHAFETRGFKGPDFSQDFHVFAVEWSPEEIVWFIDGMERSRETRGIPDRPLFLLLNLAVGGEWPGYPDETTPFPSYLEIDYVRIYEWDCPSGTEEEQSD